LKNAAYDPRAPCLLFTTQTAHRTPLLCCEGIVLAHLGR